MIVYSIIEKKYFVKEWNKQQFFITLYGTTAGTTPAGAPADSTWLGLGQFLIILNYCMNIVTQHSNK